MFFNKKFAPGTPNPKVARFTTGKFRDDYDYKLQILATTRLQIRSNALEAARVAASKKLATVGEEAFYLKVVSYPFVVMRENKMIATAGADRLQEGMRKAYGKPIGVAARVDIGSVILELLIKAENLDKAKAAFKAATTKLPLTYKILVTPLEKRIETEAAVPA